MGDSTRTVLRSLAAVALAAVLASCSAAESTGSSETTATYAPLVPITTSSLATTTSAPPTSSVSTTSSVPTASSVLTASSTVSIEDVIVSLGEFAGHWNENDLRWMTAVSDPTESYDGFLVVQQEVGSDQGALLTELELWVGALNPELRPALEPLVENYRNRYRHMVDELFPATLGGDNDAFQAALSEHESQGLPEYNEAAVRSFFADPNVASALESDGLDPDAMAGRLLGTLAGS